MLRRKVLAVVDKSRKSGEAAKGKKPRGLQISDLAQDKGEANYFGWVESFYDNNDKLNRRRFRALTWAWAATLIIGAAIPLAGALDLPTQVTAVLGFLIVIVQGFHRYYAQNAEGAAALDAFLRAIAKEALRLRAEQPPYDNQTTRLREFVNAVEGQMVRYNDASTRALRDLYYATGPAGPRGTERA
jgi:hypothetical protein